MDGLKVYISFSPSFLLQCFFSLTSSLFPVSSPLPPSLNLSALLSHSLTHPHSISPLSPPSGRVSPHRVSGQTPLSRPLEVNDVSTAAVWLCQALDAHRRSHLLTSLSLRRRQPGLMLVWPCQFSGVWVCRCVSVCTFAGICVFNTYALFLCVCVDVPLWCECVCGCVCVHVLLFLIGVQFIAVAFSEALPERPQQ